MIFTDLSKINDLLPYMSLRIGKALAYLRDTNFADLPNGEYEVAGRTSKICYFTKERTTRTT